MSSLSSLAIRKSDVRRQFERRGDLSLAEFLYGEIASRMLERLMLIRLSPELILDAGCGAGRRLRLLRQRYPKARLIGLDHSEQLLAVAREQNVISWGERLRSAWSPNKPLQWVCADLSHTGLAPESFDLVWSNLAIHWHPEPHDVLREWSRLLKPDGLAFFSGFGPATARELRTALSLANLQTATLPLVDMHDLGDLMVQYGFGDPVMDQETITLTYDDPSKLLADAKALGGNPNPNRRASLTSRHWRERLIEALRANQTQDGKLTLTLEIAYGHAWRNAIRRHATETHISVQSITRR
jgi:malonyl-CoA O-methyltransferase